MIRDILALLIIASASGIVLTLAYLALTTKY